MKSDDAFYLNLPIVGSLIASTAVVIVFVFLTFQTKSEANDSKASIEAEYSIIREELRDIKKDVKELMKRVKH